MGSVRCNVQTRSGHYERFALRDHIAQILQAIATDLDTLKANNNKT